MKRRLTTLLLAVSSMLILGGCVSQPYRYSATADGGGYYSGQSAYGNADTVVYGEAYGAPWGWGPGWGYAPGWGSVGFGVTYASHPRHHARRYRHHRRSRVHHRQHHRGHRSRGHQRHHRR